MDAPRALCDFKGALYEPEKWPRGRKMGPEGACPGFLDMGWLREGKGWGGVGAPEHHASFHTCSFFGLESMFAESSVYLILGQSHHTDQITHFREKSLVLAETGS